MINGVHRLTQPSGKDHNNAWGGSAWTQREKEALGNIFDLDYMGNSEFENSAFAHAIAEYPKHIRRKRLVAFQATCVTSHLYGTCRLLRANRATPVFAIAPTDKFDEAVAFVAGLVQRKQRSEPTLFHSTAEDLFFARTPRVVGWMDYDTSTFATVDKTMFRRLAQQFGFNVRDLHRLGNVKALTVKQSHGLPERSPINRWRLIDKLAA